MASLLYKLGIFSARRAWLVITAWVLILASTIGLNLAFAGKLSSNVSLAGTPSQLVIDDLRASFSEASRGSGQVVFHKSNGQAFTAAEEAKISAALQTVTTLAGVNGVQDPFTAQAKLDKSRADLADGKKKLAEAPAKLADAQQKLDDGKAKLGDGQKKLDAGRVKLTSTYKTLAAQAKQLVDAIAQMTAGGAPAEQIAALEANLAQVRAGEAQIKAEQAKLAPAQKKIDDGLQKIVEGQKKIDDALAELPVNAHKLETAERIMDAIGTFSTVSADNQTASGVVYFDKQISKVDEPQKEAVVASLTGANIANVQVEVSQELTKSVPDLVGPGEIIGLLIAAVVLFLMLGTLLTAGLPVLSALIGVGVAATATLALSSQIEMNSTTPMLGVMLGLAVGIDYSLFILNRHRRQLKMGTEVRESIGLANGTSGNAVVFAGLTVVIALAALNLTGVGFLGLMGSAGAVAIVIAVLIAITFTPAVISLMGMRVLSKKERALIGNVEAQHDAEQPKNASKPVWATKHPYLAILISAAILIIAAQPLASMRLGLPDGSSEPVDSTQYKAFTLSSEAFGAGVNGPVIAVATIAKSLETQPELDFQADLASSLMKLDNVSAAIPAAVSKDGTKFLFQIIPTGGPASATTEKLVYDVRAIASDFKKDFGADLGVTGLAASNIDVAKKLSDALPLYLGTVILLSMVLLLLVFRSILIPIIASAGFMLTVFATLGATVAVFQWGWLGAVFDIHDPGPIMSFVPTLIIGVVFGLAMDYQLFLGSGMREAYVHGKSPKDAINFGIHLSRAVVIAAAIIMITVFGGFAFSHMTSVRPIGFGLAVGVMFDAFLVRLILVPAAMSILGKAAWWMPKWLDRILPSVDVEGSALEREHLH